MKTQAKKELHSKSIKELSKLLKDAKADNAKLNLDKEMGKIKNTSGLTVKRVEIAVISTIINEKLTAERLAAELIEVSEPDGADGIGKVKADDKKKGVKKVTSEKSVNKQTASVKTSAVKGGKK